MKVIIPAAGTGTRLRPMTEFRPKCLVEINGVTILDRLLRSLLNFSLSEIIIVTGGFEDMIRDVIKVYEHKIKITLVNNSEYKSTNSMLSLSLTRKYWNEEFCIIDSDLLLRPQLLTLLMESPGSFLLIDNSKGDNEIDMRACIAAGNLKYLDKKLPAYKTQGEFFGLSKWTKFSAAILSEIIDRHLLYGGANSWYEFAIREFPDYHDLPVIYCSSDLWFEVDTVSDFERACELFK